MCGIVGIFDKHMHPDSVRNLAQSMADVIAHRGPDDRGVWNDEQLPLALGHRRLSIIDLTQAGHQPMVSASGRYVLVYNGEIYNFREIAQELDQQFSGHSDTEVLLAAIEAWGLEPALNRCVGMFALAVWDRQQKVLQLARDRLGIKPLYYSESPDHFSFASELRPIEQHDRVDTQIDTTALAMYMRYKYIGEPMSIYQGVRKLPPGCILELRLTEVGQACIRPFWSLEDVASRGVANRFAGDPAEAVEQLERVLSDAVSLRMVADVPVGAFLSGGIDSSLVVALMQRQSTQPVRTFSIGFGEERYNEAVYAKEVAAHLGTQHTELYVSPEEMLRVVPMLPDIYDEPFADASQVPTYLVSELTRKSVTVSLSGDGGDELFGGYTRYQRCTSSWNRVARLPQFVRNLLYRSAAKTPDALLNFGLSLAGQADLDAAKLVRRMQLASAASPLPMFDAIMSKWDHAPPVVPAAELCSSPLARAHGDLTEFVEQMMYIDQWSYLPGDILTKVDRASMAVSLEARVPLLDHRVVEFAWRLPTQYKLSGGVGKRILRQVLEKHVPSTLYDRPKQGFGVPLDDWLRGPLREWADDLLGEEALRRSGLFDGAQIMSLWSEHRSGARNAGGALWNVLMFEALMQRRR